MSRITPYRAIRRTKQTPAETRNERWLETWLNHHTAKTRVGGYSVGAVTSFTLGAFTGFNTFTLLEYPGPGFEVGVKADLSGFWLDATNAANAVGSQIGVSLDGGATYTYSQTVTVTVGTGSGAATRSPLSNTVYVSGAVTGDVRVAARYYVTVAPTSLSASNISAVSALAAS